MRALFWLVAAALAGSGRATTCITGWYVNGNLCTVCQNKPPNAEYYAVGATADCPYRCLKGYEPSSGSCIPCRAGTYSLGGGSPCLGKGGDGSPQAISFCCGPR